jgi:hypothetical protein
MANVFFFPKILKFIPFLNKVDGKFEFEILSLDKKNSSLLPLNSFGNNDFEFIALKDC